MSLGSFFREIFMPEGVIYDGSVDAHFDLRPNKPRLAIVNSAPSRDEFNAWRDEPTTQFVFMAMRNAAAVQCDAWLEHSWHGNNADPVALTEYRTRADAYESLEAGDYEAFCEWAGVAPEPNEEQAA